MSRAPEHVMHAMKPEFDGIDLNENLEPNGSGCSFEISTIRRKSASRRRRAPT
jgi:hypothetical protein